MAHRGPIMGGVSVLVVTAAFAMLEFGSSRATLAYRMAGIALVIILLVGAWLLAGFVRRHGDEIGEARFDTRNKDEREG
ncbi:MAG TPA: hypothetical protein VEC11_04290 [Allosphingosinicella sp.]|nr:hypothetical protein [Allosphingosinicella sp.]